MNVSPEGVKSVLHFHEEGEEVGAVQENWGDQGGSESVAKVRGRPLPGGERRLTASKAPCARESLRAKWALVAKDGVNQ